jgi:hypothetical protein
MGLQLVGNATVAGIAVPVRLCRTHRVDHQADQPVGHFLGTDVAGKAAVSAAATYRRAVSRSTPSRSAAFRSPVTLDLRGQHLAHLKQR